MNYEEATEFCIGKGKFLCSYDHYCPDGELSEPLRGRGAGIDVWAPISDMENDWVQITDHMNRLCKRHSLLYGPPSWGNTHGCCHNNEILCCNVVYVAGDF